MAKMEIDKATRKETAWKIKLDKDKMLILNAVEDTSLAEPSVTIVLTEGDKKINLAMSKDRFLNLTGVLDSFSQVCLGVEPKLPEEDYAPRESKESKEPKTPEKKVEKIEPIPAPAQKARLEKVEPPAVPAKVKVEAPAKMPEQLVPATASSAKKSEPTKVMTAESRMIAKLDRSKAPKSVAFPPRFPSVSSTNEDDSEDMEEPDLMDDLAGIGFEAPVPEPISTPAPARAPPEKPVSLPTMPPKVSKEPAAPPKDEIDENAPEWDPW
jgi:hypothetical protein